MKKQLRCFIAMAVGRTDTDRVYDRFIAPTLRREGIHPIFMGRLEHNDDIDKRIIREIDACDFAIADLSYARPSVYFEAGYAQRVVPVIFTARRDHFRPREDDEYGNFCVHFDLLMRNIVPWSSPTDSRFPDRLAKRIRKVIAPMLRQRQIDERARADEIRFQRGSVESRLQFLSKLFIKTLKRSGYLSLVDNEAIGPWLGRVPNRRPWLGRIPNRRVLNLGMLSVEASMTQHEIRGIADGIFTMVRSRIEDHLDDDEGYNRRRWQNQWAGYKLPTVAERNASKVAARLVLCSLGKIPRARLAAALPSFADDEAGVFRLSIPTMLCGYVRTLPAEIRVHVIDDIKSESNASERAQQLRQALRKRR